MESELRARWRARPEKPKSEKRMQMRGGFVYMRTEIAIRNSVFI